ncbi:hypothetical protein J8657_11495 [Dickeya oryzae]|uniref:Uncharacterized protein n=1 Tax=Dickeya oryzae TaxID=1240404 RepID=A0ABS5BCQ1_9GAMM|nr:hypothetical protein [Dickeya oryzae]MBP2858224.1 hypothetical protein [Dickeya oryzae]
MASARLYRVGSDKHPDTASALFSKRIVFKTHCFQNALFSKRIVSRAALLARNRFSPPVAFTLCGFHDILFADGIFSDGI